MADDTFADIELIEDEELQDIPQTGINGFERPVLFSATEDPREIINLDAGNLRVDTDAVIKNDLVVERNVGIGTTNPSAKLHVAGNTIVTGIATIGLSDLTSPTSNSSFSFELTDNTTLKIRVKGTDGVTRVGIVTLS